MIELDPEKRHEDAVQENLQRDALIKPLIAGLEVLQDRSYPADTIDAVYKVRDPRTLKEFQIVDHRHIPRGSLLIVDVRQQITAKRMR